MIMFIITLPAKPIAEDSSIPLKLGFGRAANLRLPAQLWAV